MVSDLDVISERLRLIVEVLQHRIECDAPGLHVADLRRRRRAVFPQCGLQDRDQLSIHGECQFGAPVTRYQAAAAAQS
jgi:hypothetical protein